MPLQTTLTLQGQAPFGLSSCLSWFGHTEGIVYLRVCPIDQATATRLTALAGQSFTGVHQALAPQGASPVVAMQGGSATVLTSLPQGELMPTQLPVPAGQLTPVFIQFSK